jgi:hypothetical protein
MNKRTFILCFVLPALGTALGGIIWSFAYIAVHKPGIEFDGPAGSTLTMSLIAGWLLFSMIGITLMVRQRGISIVKTAARTILIVGLVFGIALGYCISTYMMQYYAMPHSAYSNSDKDIESEYKATLAEIQKIQPFDKLKDDSPTALSCIDHDAADQPVPKKCSKVTSDQTLEFAFENEHDFNNKVQSLGEKLHNKGWVAETGAIHKTFRTPAGGDNWGYIMFYMKNHCTVHLTAGQQDSNKLTASYGCTIDR